MIIKLDMEKAFDSIEWTFIYNVLKDFGFSPKLIQLIMECITTTYLEILVNGRKMEPFKPARGIRQGDPLSSYIFILCME